MSSPRSSRRTVKLACIIQPSYQVRPSNLVGSCLVVFTPSVHHLFTVAFDSDPTLRIANF